MEVLASNETFSAPMEETYKKLEIDPNSVTTLDAYLSEYYSQILKKLKEVGAQGRQTGAVLKRSCCCSQMLLSTLLLSSDAALKRRCCLRTLGLVALVKHALPADQGATSLSLWADSTLRSAAVFLVHLVVCALAASALRPPV